MRTIDFLWTRINADAPITIAKANGDILYEGIAFELDFSLVDYTEVESIALGTNFDIIITVKEQ